jgi:hypothetical protein
VSGIAARGSVHDPRLGHRSSIAIALYCVTPSTNRNLISSVTRSIAGGRSRSPRPPASRRPLNSRSATRAAGWRYVEP